MKILRYSTELKGLWDGFIQSSKNATFLHFRNYMDYHADRFQDHSLVFMDEADKLLAVLPANQDQLVLQSHGGLTYGGLLMGDGLKSDAVLEIIQSLSAYCIEQGITRIIYKGIPHVYHNIPAEEDLYALFREGYQLTRRDISSVFHFGKSSPSSKKNRGMRKAEKEGFRLESTLTPEKIFDVINENMIEKYGVQPVHSPAEMLLLKERFPDNIQFLQLQIQDEVQGGAILYLNRDLVHIQYLAVSAKARLLRGQDFIVQSLIERFKDTHAWLDYGISTEQRGRFLNTGLIHAKEGFNFRAICYDTYERELHS